MSQNELPRSALGYVLLHHGPKHSRARLDRRAGAHGQLRMIGLYAAQHGFRVTAVESEYLRYASNPRDFATLFGLLERCKSHGEADGVILDDIERLLKRLPTGQAHELVIEFSPWFEFIHDSRLNCRLDSISGDRWRELVFAAEKHKRDQTIARQVSGRRRSAHPGQTAAARASAAIELARRADEIARTIGALRDEFLAQYPDRKLTFAKIARVANERGLRTTRGSEWTSARVSRALRRLAQHTSD